MNIINLFNKKADRDLIVNGSLLTAILCLAVPIVLNNFIQTMYNLTDTYWLGRIGKESVAAITVVSPVQNVIIQFGQGISLAGSVLISQFFGAKDNENAGDMADHVFVCSVVFSVAAAFLCFISTGAIVDWLGAEGAVNSSAGIYLRIIVLDMPFLFMINLYSAVHQAQGDTVTPMLLNLLRIILNIILDPVLMFGLNLGITGAALATLSAKIPGAVIAFLSLTNRKKLIYIYRYFQNQNKKRQAENNCKGGTSHRFGQQHYAVRFSAYS